MILTCLVVLCTCNMQCKCKPRHSHKDTVKGFKPAACQRITQEQKFKQNSETHHPTDTRASDCRVSKVHTLVLHTLVAVIQSSCSFQSSVHSAIKIDGWNLCTTYFKRILNTPFILDIYTFKFWRELRPDCCCLVFVTWRCRQKAAHSFSLCHHILLSTL